MTINREMNLHWYFYLLGVLFFQKSLQILHVVVLEVTDVAARSYDTLMDRKVHSFVTAESETLIDSRMIIIIKMASNIHENDVTAFGIGRNRTGNGRESVSINRSFFQTHEISYAVLQIEMDICSLILSLTCFFHNWTSFKSKGYPPTVP